MQRFTSDAVSGVQELEPVIVPVVSYWLSATGAELRVRRHCAPVHCSSRGRSKQQHALRSIGRTRDRCNI
jgi:hypothetical protein